MSMKLFFKIKNYSTISLYFSIYIRFSIPSPPRAPSRHSQARGGAPDDQIDGHRFPHGAMVLRTRVAAPALRTLTYLRGNAC